MLGWSIAANAGFAGVGRRGDGSKLEPIEVVMARGAGRTSIGECLRSSADTERRASNPGAEVRILSEALAPPDSVAEG